MTLTTGSTSTAVTINNASDCYLWGGDWIEYRMNVSNFFNSLLFCFLSVTTEGWTSLSIPLASLKGENVQPVINENRFLWLFTVIFFFIGNMIMLNVFVGMTMNNFKKIKEEVTGEAKLTKVEK
jgi:hypothetical protein